MAGKRALATIAVLSGIALAVALSATGATPKSSRVARTSLTITALGKTNGIPGKATAKFDLLGASAADTDFGTLRFDASVDAVPQKTADGLPYRPATLVQTLKGKHGTLRIRALVRMFDVVKTDEYVTTGTWSIVKATGRYAGLTGEGSLVGIRQTPPDSSSISDWTFSFRYQGLVRRA
jgi:hypothetical protein